MASLIQFTNNYRDCSTDAGYQFEFYCDMCGGGCMSQFKPSKFGVAGSMLRAASSFFSSAASASSAADQGKNLMRGKERDEALRDSVEQAKQQFKLCKRCGHWVCEAACWNDSRSLCQRCAPNLDHELAAAQNQGRMQWMQRKAFTTDMISDMDITQDGGGKKALGASCSNCGAEVSGKFCGQCGTPAPGAKRCCTNCGTEAGPTAKFCGTCGQKVP